jgi:putative phosphoesterase
MRIGLISDTHIPDAAKELPKQVADIFAGVDLILHAGDICDVSCLDWLERIAPVLACEGNEDYLRRLKDPRVQRTRVLEVHGRTIGLTHGFDVPEIPPHRTVEKMMHNEFGRPVDIVVFGDTHVEEVTTLKGVLCINPGSPTWPHHFSHFLGTVSLLDIEADAPPRVRILRLDTLTDLNMAHPTVWWTVR